MAEIERDFKGVWIPKTVWLDERLNALDKIILTEIDSLDNGERGCYASNKYIADFCQCSETKVSTAISKLIKFGYLYMQKFDGRQRELKSRLSNFERQNCKNSKADFEDLKESNTSNNTFTNTNKKDNKDTPQAGEPPSPKAAPIDYDLFKDIYNKFCSSLPQVKLLSDKRKKAIRDFLKQLEFRDFEMACKKANENNFLTGSNDRGWKADFDFIIKVDKTLSILEGKYDNNDTGGSHNGTNGGSNAEVERPSWSGDWY